MIKNIIFDYGAVIFDIDHQLTIQAFKDIGLQAENDFFGKTCLFHNSSPAQCAVKVTRSGTCLGVPI